MTKSQAARENVIAQWKTIRQYDLDVKVVDDETIEVVWIKPISINKGEGYVSSVHTRSKVIKVGDVIPIFDM